MIEIIVEPCDVSYSELITTAFRECATFSLVSRPGVPMSEGGVDTLRKLAPFLVDQLSSSEWPGTVLLGHTAVVRHYETHLDAMPSVLRVGRLYAWVAPSFPEDIAFYTSDRTVWLGSSSHEAFAFFGEGAAPLEELRRTMPNLALRRRRTSS